MKEKCKSFFRGFKRTVSGSFVSGLFILSGISFWMIPDRSGYQAAALFLIGISLFVCGAFAMYALGGGKPAAPGKYAK